jgi:hypothetical protein
LAYLRRLVPKFFQKFRRQSVVTTVLEDAKLLADVALHSFTTAIDMLDEVEAKLTDHLDETHAKIEAMNDHADSVYEELRRSKRLAANLRSLTEVDQ